MDLALLGDWHGPSGNWEFLITNPTENLVQVLRAQNISQNWQGRYWRLMQSFDRNHDNPISVGSLRFVHIEFEFEEDMEAFELLNERLERLIRP